MKRSLLAALFLAAVVIGCKSSSSDPKGVLNDFFKALSEKDMAKARSLATADSKSMLDMMEMGMKMSQDTASDMKFDPSKMEFGEVKIEGDKATVPVTEKTSGETLNYTLKKEDGNWKVAFDKSSMMTMGMEKMNEKGIDVSDSLDAAMDEIENLDRDSLRRGIDEGIRALDSAKDALENLKP